MPDILSIDNFWSAARQRARYAKTTTRTTVATGWFSLFDIAGQPGAGTLAAGNTANGVVPDDTSAGYPPLNAFGASAIGRLLAVDHGNSVACRIAMFDRLFVAGAYAFNANQPLTAQPSFAARVPGADYKHLEMWVEQVAAATGNQAVNVTYTNEDGTPSRTTGATGIGAAPTVGRCWQLPYQSGDSGVQQITNVAGSVATAGTFNVMILRRLWGARIKSAGDGDVHDFLRTKARQLYATSALYVLVSADSTSSGLVDLDMEVGDL